MLQPAMRSTHPSRGFHSLFSAAFVGYFLLRWRTVPHSAFRVIIEKIRRHASARHEEHASFMGVPQSTKWRTVPPQDLVYVQRKLADMLQPVMRSTHPSWGFHSLLSAAFVGYFPLHWETVPHSALRIMQRKCADMFQPVMRSTHPSWGFHSPNG